MNNRKKTKKILFLTSTIPTSSTDPVPGFVRDEAIWFKKIYPHLSIDVLAPHNSYSKTKRFTRHQYYNEYRFHYFWPFAWEKLAGRGIQPALKKNKLLYLELPALIVAEFFATWRYTRKHKPDLLYAHWFTPQALVGAAVSKITKTPFVFDTQASDAIVLKNVPFSPKIVATVCRQAYAYTAPSQMTVDKLLYFSTDRNRQEILSKLHMIPYGTSSVTVGKDAIERVRKKYDLGGKKVFYFIGRLVDRKGVDILIKAFGKLYQKDNSLRLIIVGDGQERQKLERLTKDTGVSKGVIFTGFLAGEERFALLSLVDVCVIASINVGDQAEGLPVVFMEGITFGKTMVISDATGAHEVAQDEINSFIARAGSVSSLSTKMKQALNISMAQDKSFDRAVRKLAKEFQWPAIIKKRYQAFQLND